MHIQRLRPVILADGDHGNACSRCDVRHRSVCSAVGDAGLARLAAAAIHVEVQAGQTFIREGDPASDFFNVTRGTAKLFKLLPDGRQQITGFAGVGHFLGLAVSAAYGFSAEAIEPMRLCRFARPKLRRLLDDFPQLERRLLETACNELATAQEQMLLLGRKTARERVASFLVARSQDATPCGQAVRVRLPMTRGEIADYLGLTIETVSRTFSRFKADGWIVTSQDEVVLLDRGALEETASGAG